MDKLSFKDKMIIKLFWKNEGVRIHKNGVFIGVSTSVRSPKIEEMTLSYILKNKELLSKIILYGITTEDGKNLLAVIESTLQFLSEAIKDGNFKEYKEYYSNLKTTILREYLATHFDENVDVWKLNTDSGIYSKAFVDVIREKMRNNEVIDIQFIDKFFNDFIKTDGDGNAMALYFIADIISFLKSEGREDLSSYLFDKIVDFEINRIKNSNELTDEIKAKRINSIREYVERNKSNLLGDATLVGSVIGISTGFFSLSLDGQIERPNELDPNELDDSAGKRR